MTLQLQGEQSGEFSINAAVAADNDANAANSAVVVVVNLSDMTDAADITVMVSDAMLEAETGAEFGLKAEVKNIGLVGAQDSVLTISVPAEISLEMIDSEVGSCIKQNGAVECMLGTLEADATSKVELKLKGIQAGDFTSTVSVAAANDANTTNNSIEVAIKFKADDSGDDSGDDSSDDNGDDNGDSNPSAAIISANSNKCLTAKNTNAGRPRRRRPARRCGQPWPGR
jgi:hypothetical protein